MSSEFLGEEAYGFLKGLASYERLAGTPGEEEARRYIVSVMEKAGYKTLLEEFTVKTFRILRNEFHVLEPWSEEVDCRGVGFSGSTPEEGVVAPLRYVETGDPLLLPRTKGEILLLSESPPTVEKLFELSKYEPSGIVLSEGTPFRKPSQVDRLFEVSRRFRVPTVFISFEDAFRLVKNNASKSRLVLTQQEFDADTCNIVVEKKGVKYPEEIIVVGAHYDTVYGVKGGVDNAGGVALLMELAKSMSSLDLKRTVRFVFFTGEELGLRGSFNYVEKHKDEVEKVMMMVNLDVNGGAIGGCNAVVTGPQEVKTYLEAMSKELGVNLSVSQDVYSSDSIPFSNRGVPSVSFYRRSGAGVHIHTPEDDSRFTAPIGFKMVGIIVREFLLRMANAESFPFKREIPEDVKKKVQEYLKNRGFEMSSVNV
ncbi:MAG: M20/M25/M40 family metallo-hydrolase [Candidatus Brockarchaeota archaeon]|nr:M20/M25/M40 family metallo-hydrolase [Candidatus Brockarchaeota archaeon]